LIKVFKPPKAGPAELRKFGIIMAAALIALGVVIPLIKHQPLRTWPRATALVFFVAGIVYPRCLSLVHRSWMTLGHYLGLINTRIILTIVFFAIITPLGLIKRTFGRDPLDRNFLKEGTTYRDEKSSVSSMDKPY
jgi:hypothetical protein